jgi:hypothetical protein
MGLLSNNNVSSLLGLGADAMDNMFDVSIIPPAALTDILSNITAGRPGMVSFDDPQFKNNITIRADGFEPPKFNVKTYPVRYKAVEIERPSTRIEGKREFKITFRLDSNYIAYKFLGSWKSTIMQISSGYATNALWGGESDNDPTVGKVNNVFGEVNVVALSRPIRAADSDPFKAHGVTNGKFTNDTLKSEPLTIPTSDELTKWTFKQCWISDLEEPKYKTDGGDIIKITATFKFGEITDPIYNTYGNG